jgi:hypothetical protein
LQRNAAAGAPNGSGGYRLDEEGALSHDRVLFMDFGMVRQVSSCSFAPQASLNVPQKYIAGRRRGGDIITPIANSDRPETRQGHLVSTVLPV